MKTSILALVATAAAVFAHAAAVDAAGALRPYFGVYSGIYDTRKPTALAPLALNEIEASLGPSGLTIRRTTGAASAPLASLYIPAASLEILSEAEISARITESLPSHDLGFCRKNTRYPVYLLLTAGNPGAADFMIRTETVLDILNNQAGADGQIATVLKDWGPLIPAGYENGFVPRLKFGGRLAAPSVSAPKF
jgi:hypothetical protein